MTGYTSVNKTTIDFEPPKPVIELESPMLWNLNQDVSWGNHQILKAVPSRFRSIVAVAGNFENLPIEETPLALPEKIPYFRVACPDTETPTPEYWALLRETLAFVHTHNLLPVLVHCRAGQMRSPAVAAYASFLYGYGSFRNLLDQARALRPDICYDQHGMKRYVAAMLEHFQVTWE